jgi:DNA-binding transcriptional LysR family regulator
MIEIYLLEQLLALEDCGTLSEAAKKIHLTQPTLTRSMQKLEQEIGVPLFHRGRKRIQLNDTGKLVAKYARQIVSLEMEMKDAARRLEQAKHILSIGSIAPVPIREFRPLLAEYCRGKTIRSEIRDEQTLLDGLYANTYQMIILNRPLNEENCLCYKTFCERLYYCFSPANHPASKEGVTFAEINGVTMLMPSEVGFWRDIVKKYMPDSQLIEQNTNEEINTIVQNSSFASFNTDIGIRHHILRPNRIAVPILDSAAATYYYCICLKDSPIGNALLHQIQMQYSC